MSKNQNNNLRLGTLEDLSWAPGEQTESLEKVFKYVSNEAQKAVDWYLSRKESKRIGARTLRGAVIVATTVAGIIPLISQIYVSNGEPYVSPAWASVALILAGAFILLDRFFGFSSAWMRFLTTEMRIRNALQAFQMDWEIQRASLKGAEPNDDQVQEMLSSCKTFLTQINAFIAEEMAAWRQEFQTALKQVDDAARAQAEIRKLGGANVVVKNGDQCDSGWELSVDGGTRKRYTGRTAALRDLIPGIHAIKVAGTIKGKAANSESAVTISAGAAARVEIELA